MAVGGFHIGSSVGLSVTYPLPPPPLRFLLPGLPVAPADEIEWDMVDFEDNADCLTMVEKKRTGILSVLDDECRNPQGSDEGWLFMWL